jgi:DNA-binding response OmpR family regulator
MALIMIAEDDPGIVDMLSLILKREGHHVSPVSDGAQFIEKAKELKPDLLVVDIMMPGVYGSSAVKSLREARETAGTPVLFVTAVPPEQVRKVVPEAPDVMVLHKPVDAARFLEAVNTLLP